MKRSLARSLMLLPAALIAAIAITPTANAAALPDGFSPRIFHGKYAFGYDFRGAVRLNLQTGRGQVVKIPEGTGLQMEVASDNAFAGVTYPPRAGNKRRLSRFDVHSGPHTLESYVPFPDEKCPTSVKPIWISPDGTVVAVTRVTVYDPLFGCRFDASQSKVRRYVPRRKAEDVRVPAKYLPWLESDLITANENTLVLAKASTGATRGEIVAFDMATRKLIARRRAGRLTSVSLANPHSLYFAQDGGRASGRVMYWRLERRAAKSLFRGEFRENYTTTNCGNRALVFHGSKFSLLSRTDKVLLQRKTRYEFGDVICSSKYLYYVVADDYNDYSGEYSRYWRHFVNISRLP